MSSLTEEQSKLVTDSYGLIKFSVYSVQGMCKGNKSLIEDLESVAALEMCKAAINYDAQKGAFDDYAFICMRMGLLRFLKYEFSHGIKVGNQSIEELSKLSFIPDEDYTQGGIDDSIDMVEGMIDLQKTLTDKELILYGLRYIMGFSTEQIKSKMGISKNTFHRIHGNVKKKVAVAFDWNLSEQMLKAI